MSSSSRDLIVNIQFKDLITSYNIYTHKSTDHGDLRNLETAAQIFSKLQTIFNLNQIKAMSFCFYGIENPTLKKQYEFLCECRKFCEENGIYYYFPSVMHNRAAAAISQTKTIVKENEIVMIFLLDTARIPPLGFTLIRKKHCYEIVRQGFSEYQQFTQQWKEDVMGDLKPAKVILKEGRCSEDFEKAQLFFKSYNPVIIRRNEFVDHYNIALENNILSLMDGKVNQYDVANSCWCTFEVRLDKESLVNMTDWDMIPFERSIVIHVDPTKSVSLFCNLGKFKPPELVEDIKLSTFKCKKVTVTFKIDINAFYDFKAEPIEDEAEMKGNMSNDYAVDKRHKENESSEVNANEGVVAESPGNKMPTIPSSNRNLIVEVNRNSFVYYNIESNEEEDWHIIEYDYRDARFFEQFHSIFNVNRIKAIAFLIHGVGIPTFAESYGFRLRCREFCQKYDIFCYFPFLNQILPMAALSDTKTMVKEGETVAIASSGNQVVVSVTILIREKSCYRIIKISYSSSWTFNEAWKQEVLGSYNPMKVIFMLHDGYRNSQDLKKVKQLFKSYDSIEYFTSNDMNPVIIKQNVTKVLHLMGEKINQYDIQLPCGGRYQVRDDENCCLIEAFFTDIVPYEKSIVIDVNSKKSVSLFCTTAFQVPTELVKEIKLSTLKCKKVTVTLKLDINSFYDFKVEPFDGAEKKDEKFKDNGVDKPVDEKESSASDVNKSTTESEMSIMPEKARMIFDKQNFCVSYFTNGKEYILNDSDDLDKAPIYISFTEKKPLIGKAAMDIYAEKPSFVVFDLIKLCSISNTDIESPKWGFTLSKEGESIMVIWETPDGKQKQTVEFLLALIIKNGKDRIKKKYGKRMEEIEIGFDSFIPSEMLKKNFVEAGKLLKINIVFV